MSILSFEDLQTDSVSNEIFRLLVRRSPWFEATDIFKLVNPQITRSRERERMQFPFELRLQSLWEHNAIERLRLRLPEDFHWPIEPVAEVRREDVEAKRDVGKALKFFSRQWVKRLDVSAFELLDDADDDEGLEWINVVHIFSTNRSRKDVIHPLICADRTPGSGADWMAHGEAMVSQRMLHSDPCKQSLSTLCNGRPRSSPALALRWASRRRLGGGNPNQRREGRNLLL